ncbi:MAG TPA: hypothetical protein EYQ75_01325 [Planctomycetaceae bacterium]|nr:hypothetical protein [Planctomycetaceae bacterium]
MRCRHKIVLTSALACSLLTSAVVVGQGAAGPNESGNTKLIEPPDVYVLVMLVHAELDLIRVELGKPVNRQADLRVEEAAPRDVYFQAVTMFRKAERFCYEQTREHNEIPEIPNRDLLPADVYEMVDGALLRIRCVKHRLNTPERAVGIERDDSKTPTDVFKAIVQANRTLNILMQKKFSPSDVYQEVTLAIGYGAKLLEEFPGTTRIPDDPTFERKKKPSDVYERLVRCSRKLRKIAESSGLKMIELAEDEETVSVAQPSDVYDIASLVVAQLVHLQNQIAGSTPPRAVFNPGLKIPSDVYQRVGILEAQLDQLESESSNNPDWLKTGKN